MTDKKFTTNIKFTQTALIANGGTQSAAVDLSNDILIGFLIPASFEGTTITIQAALTAAGTYNNVYRNGADLSYTVAASKVVLLDNTNPRALEALRFIKFTSGTSVAADRTITLITIPRK